jgi:hypothetical protein
MKDLVALRYPIGNFEFDKKYTIVETRKHIDEIGEFPKILKKIVKKLRDGALDRSYRPHGWTIRQVIHHLADSHMNAYIRMKLALTENTPVIKAYEEQLWAEMEDAKHGSVKISMKLLSALHQRWVDFLLALSDDDLLRGYYNPVSKRTITVQDAIALYAWHGKHHLGHIKIVAEGKAPKFEKKPADDAPKPEAATQKKRVMSDEHKAKIQASRAVKNKSIVPEAAVATPPASKRARRSSEEVAAEKAAKAAAPKLTRAEVLERARAARKPKAEAAPVAETASKRARRSSEEVAAEKAAKAAVPKLTRAEVLERARAARKPKAEATPTGAPGTPKVPKAPKNADGVNKKAKK